MCVSSGTISCAGRTFFQTPRSTRSSRTIQRRNRLSRLHAPPDDGREKKYATPGFGFLRPYTAATSSASARVENDCERIADVDRIARRGLRRRSLRSIPLRSIICLQDPHQRGEVGAVGPAVHEVFETIAIPRRLKSRTNAAGDGPITASMPSIELSTLCTRPNASADAMKRDHFPVGGTSRSGAPSTPDRIPNDRR